MLQLEQYQTARYLAWSAQRRERWTSTNGLTSGLGTIVTGSIDLLAGTHLTTGPLAFAAQAVTNAWLWRAARPEPATKPLVLTQRARRLLAGQALLTALLAGGPAAVLALRSSTRPRALAALGVGTAASTLLVPPITAGANLLLWPVEEAIRRYYLNDARRLLRQSGVTVVGVAGSYGKTSTKEILATILGGRWSVLKPPGSYNTPMGLTRVIREQLEPTHELFVAELGDYVPGDIRFLCRLVRPSVGVLTTIGPEHLERFKTMERVIQTKEELFEELPPDGIAVVNQDDPLVRAIGDRAEARGSRVIRYGQLEPGAQIRVRDVRTSRDGLSFIVEADGHGEAQFQIGLLGRHNVMNVLAATGAALELGMSLDEIARAARRIQPVEHRLQPIRGAAGVLVIDDTFNSNPRGAAEALTVLGELEGGKKVLVTPGMIELAEREVEEHRALGRRAAAVCDEVILVGPERTRPIAAGLQEGGFSADHLHVVRDRAEATAALGKLVTAGDVVLWENDLPDTYAEETGASSKFEVQGSTLETRHIASNPEPRTLNSVVVDGVRIAYRVDGPPDAPTVMVLHGWGASEAVSSIQAVLRATHRTIAPDLPGFGQSDPPPTVWGAADYANAVRGLMDALGIGRASFIGHSRGGHVSIVIAAAAPQRVDRLVLVDSAGIRPMHGPRYRARVLAFKAGRRVLATPPLAGPIGAPLRAWFGRTFGSDDYRQASGTLRGTLVRLVNEDVQQLLPKVAASTLLIWGDQDDATPLSDGTLMERLIPDAGLVVFPGAGHFAYADDLGRFGRIVGHFLASSQ